MGLYTLLYTKMKLNQSFTEIFSDFCYNLIILEPGLYFENGNLVTKNEYQTIYRFTSMTTLSYFKTLDLWDSSTLRIISFSMKLSTLSVHFGQLRHFYYIWFLHFCNRPQSSGNASFKMTFLEQRKKKTFQTLPQCVRAERSETLIPDSWAHFPFS